MGLAQAPCFPAVQSGQEQVTTLGRLRKFPASVPHLPGRCPHSPSNKSSLSARCTVWPPCRWAPSRQGAPLTAVSVSVWHGCQPNRTSTWQLPSTMVRGSRSRSDGVCVCHFSGLALCLLSFLFRHCGIVEPLEQVPAAASSPA